MKNAFPIVLIVLICISLFFGWKSFHRKSNRTSAVEYVNTEVSEHKNDINAEKIQKIESAPIKQKAGQIVSQKTGNFKKLHLNFRFLLHADRRLAELNPSVDFKSIRNDDPRIASLKIPDDLRLLVRRDPNCNNSKIGSPQIESFNVTREMTLAELNDEFERDPCSLAIYPNSNLATAALPKRFDLKKLLNSNDPNMPVVFDFQNLQQKISSNLSSQGGGSNLQPAQIYMLGVGSMPVSADTKTPVPVLGMAFSSKQAQFYSLPFADKNPENYIANLNNSIIQAVDNGAKIVMIPYLNPGAVAAASEYAKQHGVEIEIVAPGSKIPVTIHRTTASH